MDYSPPGSSVHGISQAKIMEWVAIPFLEQGWGILPTQGSNPHLMHRQADSKPPGKVVDVSVYPFST